MKQHNSLFAVIITIVTIFSPCCGMDDPMGDPNSWLTKSIIYEPTEQPTEPAPLFDLGRSSTQESLASSSSNGLGTATIGQHIKTISEDPVFMTINLANQYLKSSDKTEKNKNLLNLVNYLHQPSKGWIHEFFKKINKETIGNFFIIVDDLRQPKPIYPNQKDSDDIVLQLKKDIYSKILPTQDSDYLIAAAKNIDDDLKRENVSDEMLASYKADLSDLLPTLKKYVDDGQKNMIDVLLKAQEVSNFRSDYINLFLNFIYKTNIQDQIHIITSSFLKKEIKLDKLKELFDQHQNTDPRKILPKTPQKFLNLWLKDAYAIKTAYEKLLQPEESSPNFIKMPSAQQQAAEREEELSLFETNINKLKNSLSRLASQYNVSEENTNLIVRQIKYFIPQIISFLKKYNGQSRIKELQQILNAITKKEYDNNIIESWIKQIDKIYEVTRDQITSPETFASSFISMQKDAANLFNNPDLQIEYLDEKNWNHEIKTYILQHLWLKARDESNLENMAFFRKKLKDIGEQTPTASHIAGAVEIINFTYVPEVPDDADVAFVKIIENYYQTLRKNNKKQLSVISKNLTARFNAHRKSKPNTFSIDWAKKDESLLLEYIKFLTFIDPTNKKLFWLKNELIKIENTIKEFFNKDLLSKATAFLKGSQEPSIEELEKYKANLEALELLRPSKERQNTINALTDKIIEKRTAIERAEVVRAKEQLKNVEKNITARIMLENEFSQEIEKKQQEKAPLKNQIETIEQDVSFFKAEQEKNRQKLAAFKAQQEALEGQIQEQTAAEALWPQIDELRKEFNTLPAYTKNIRHFVDMVPYATKITDFYNQYPNNKEIQDLYRKLEDKIAEDAAKTIMYLIDESSVRVTAPYYFQDPYLKKWYEKYTILMKKILEFESLENSDLCNPSRYQNLSDDDALASILTLRTNLIKLGEAKVNLSFKKDATDTYVKSLELWFINGIKGNITPEQQEAFLAMLNGVCATINDFSERIRIDELAQQSAPKPAAQLQPKPVEKPRVAQRKPIPFKQEEPQVPNPAVKPAVQKQPSIVQPAEPIRSAAPLAQKQPNESPTPSGWSYWLSTQPITDFFGWIKASRLNPFNWFK